MAAVESPGSLVAALGPTVGKTLAGLGLLLVGGRLLLRRVFDVSGRGVVGKWARCGRSQLAYLQLQSCPYHAPCAVRSGQENVSGFQTKCGRYSYKPQD